MQEVDSHLSDAVNHAGGQYAGTDNLLGGQLVAGGRLGHEGKGARLVLAAEVEKVPEAVQALHTMLSHAGR